MKNSSASEIAGVLAIVVDDGRLQGPTFTELKGDFLPRKCKEKTFDPCESSGILPVIPLEVKSLAKKHQKTQVHPGNLT